MSTPWIVVNILIAALCQPRQSSKTAAPIVAPAPPVTVLEKPLSFGRKLIVTWEEVPMELTAKRAAEQQEEIRKRPGTMFSDHLYAYAYILMDRNGQRSVLWTEREGSFGAQVKPRKACEGQPDVELLDVTLQDNILLVLYQQSSNTSVNVVRLNVGPRMTPAPPGSRQLPPAFGREAVQFPLGSGRVVERAGPFDGVAGGSLAGPDGAGNVTVQLKHVVKQKDGTPRITVYHLIHDAQGQEFWLPDPANTYRGDKPGIHLNNPQP